MIILKLSPYLTIDEDVLKTKNKTGFGRTTWDLSKYWETTDSIFIASYDKFEIDRYKNIRFINLSPKNIIFNISIKKMIEAIRFFLKYKSDSKLYTGNRFKQLLSLLRAFGLYRYIMKVIKTVKPDIIHIHGIVPECLPFIEAARKLKIPYVINIHGIVTATDFNYGYSNNWEQNIVRNLYANNDDIIFISSGIKHYIESEFKVSSRNKNNNVIINGCRSFKQQCSLNTVESIRKKYLINNKSILLISVGAITVDKGQRRIIESLSKMNEEVKNKISLLVLGNGNDIDYCKMLVKKYNFENTVYFLGYVENDFLVNYYCASDLLVQASMGPGFSRMYWETFMTGTPAIACKLQPGILDIYNPDVMLLSKDYTSDEIAKTILRALIKKWDANKIIEYSKQCNWEKKCQQYRDTLHRIVNKREISNKESIIKDLVRRCE